MGAVPRLRSLLCSHVHLRLLHRSGCFSFNTDSGLNDLDRDTTIGNGFIEMLLEPVTKIDSIGMHRVFTKEVANNFTVGFVEFMASHIPFAFFQEMKDLWVLADLVEFGFNNVAGQIKTE